MTTRPLRFLHSGDWQLHRVLEDVAEVPDHLRGQIRDAAYLAAENVIDTALSEEVDFVVLAGNLLRPSGVGPRGFVFLCEQFERLAAAEIPVYWAGGKCDPPSAWPEELKLPENVYIFKTGTPQRVYCEQDDLPLAMIVGASREPKKLPMPPDFVPEVARTFTIALSASEFSSHDLRPLSVDYWALGGRTIGKELFEQPHFAGYAGAPQPFRWSSEAGSCWVVDVKADGTLQRQRHVTEAVRLQKVKVSLPAELTLEQIEARIRTRLEELLPASDGPTVLVELVLSGTHPQLKRLGREAESRTLLGKLRKALGHQSPAVWCTGIETVVDGLAFQPSEAKNDLLRDFLEQANQVLSEKADRLKLETLLRQQGLPSVEQLLGDSLEREFADAHAQGVWRQVCRLGMEMLTPEETTS